MKPSEFYRVSSVAEIIGVPRSTLKSAAERGELPLFNLGDGLPVVRLTDAKQWHKDHGGRPRGRQPKPNSG